MIKGFFWRLWGMTCAIHLIMSMDVAIESSQSAYAQRALEERSDRDRTSTRWETLKSKAIERSSLLQARRAFVTAKRAEIEAVDRWPDPKLSYRYSPHPIETKAGPLIHSMMISQRLTWPAELDHTMKIAELKFAEAEHSVTEAELMFIESIEQSMWSLWFIESHREILKSELSTLEQLVDHITGLVEAQPHILSSLSKARYEFRLKQERLDQTLAEMKSSRLNLGLLLEGKGSFEAQPPSDLIDPILSLCDQPQTLEKVLEVSSHQVEENKIPRLERASLMVQQTVSSLERLRIRQRPQIELGIQWSVIDNLGLLGQLKDDVFTAQIGGSFPIWGTADRAARSSLISERDQKEFERREQSERWRSELEDQRIKILERSRQIEIIKNELSPLANEVLKQKQREYEAGLVDLGELYRARLVLLGLKRDFLLGQRSCATSLSHWRSLTNSALTPLFNDHIKGSHRPQEHAQ